ncbi:MAG: hypothetical protein EP343_06725 [Deltaproteobacteria bacterium]|nr:MAG: hypothetical protein EP343_06725 [Deltaproteobacteria bacterium]
MSQMQRPPSSTTKSCCEDRQKRPKWKMGQGLPFPQLAWVVMFSAILGMGTASAATRTLCRTLYSKKQFVRAARCYNTLAQALQSKKRHNTEELSDLNQFLRNAALCMQRQAKTESSAVRKSYWYEQALLFVQTLLKNRYYADTSQKNLSVYIRNQVNENVGYTQVTVNTGKRSAKVSVTGGYRFETIEQQSQLWQIKLRPGSYTILCQHTEGGNVARVLKLTRGDPPNVVNCAPPVRNAQNPPALLQRPVVVKAAHPNRVPGIALLVGGSLALAAGIGLVTWGILENEQNNQAARDLQQQLSSYDLETAQTTSAQRNNLVAEHQDAVSKYGAGIGVGTAGALSLVIGAILYARPTKPPTPPSLSRAQAKSSIVFKP